MSEQPEQHIIDQPSLESHQLMFQVESRPVILNRGFNDDCFFIKEDGPMMNTAKLGLDSNTNIANKFPQSIYMESPNITMMSEVGLLNNGNL